MLMTLTELRNNLNRLNIAEVVESVYAETKEALEDLNTKQLRDGLTTAGGRFPSYAYPDYAQFKQQLNPAPGLGNPDLRLTGEFHSSIVATYNGVSINVGSNLSGTTKVDQLERWYGEDRIYGLTEENRRVHVEENIQPALQEQIERITGLTYEL